MTPGTTCWVGETAAAPMDHLLPIAQRALEAEDRALALAFAQRDSSGRRRKTSEGLLYHLYETTLAYVIFRAWLPIADVEWKCAYEAGTCDLVVHGDDDRILVELKWWGNMRAKTMAALKKDVVRLRTANAGARYLICFWWNFDGLEEWAGDREALLATAADMAVSASYLDRFPTRVLNRLEVIVVGYFAMGAFRI